MRLVFDGHDLADEFVVEYHVTRGLPTWEPTLVDVAGRDGAIYAGTRALPPVVEADLYFMDETRPARMESVRSLAAILAVREPKQLVLGDEGGLWRLAVPQLEQPLTAFLDADAVHVSFVCPDPWLYGDSHEWALGASTTVLVGGSFETPIDITVTGATAGTLTVTNLTTGASFSVTGIPIGAAVEVSSSEFTVMVNGVAKVLTSSSKWLVVQPGKNVITVTGGGSSVVARVTDRWW